MIEFTAEEIFRQVRIAQAVANVEVALDLLAEHARELQPELANRVLEAIARYGDARRAIVEPLSRPLPAPSSSN